jgi:aryl-alcohol dehydrogenase-like predicted oxidoreductase
MTGSIPEKRFGKTDSNVTAVGLGGEGVLRTWNRESAAVGVIEEALEQGISYFDSARAYSGSESYYGQVWPRRKTERSKVFQTSKSAMRTKTEALSDLDRTLENMGIEQLDLWQIHDIRTEEDLKEIGSKGGALEAFAEAKEKGKVRFIGVTGHHDPAVLTRAVKEWPVDSVLLPVNPVEAVLGGFLDGTLDAAVEKGVAVVGMKVLGAAYYLNPRAGITAEQLIRFALAQPITLAIVGCSTPAEVAALADAARFPEPMTTDEQDRLKAFFRPQVERLAYYRGVL